MSWENIEERLAASLPQQMPFPEGMIWLPPTYINVADWLSSVARTEQERKELETGAMKFLQYRWPFEILVEMFWDDIGATISGDYKVEAMYVGNRAYVFLSKVGQPQVVAALEPANEQRLYSAVVKTLLSNPNAIAEPPARIVCPRPDLVPQSVVEQAFRQRIEG